VSAGTYLRSLARDIGAKLGCGAHLTALRRTAVGPLRLADAVAPEAVTWAALQDAAAASSYFILNAAVGGSWGGQKGIDDGIFPQKYVIDYVRVYEERK